MRIPKTKLIEVSKIIQRGSWRSCLLLFREAEVVFDTYFLLLVI